MQRKDVKISTPQIITLFSGGLDSLLVALLLQEQGIKVRCLHFFSPFFGKRDGAEYWRKLYALDVVCLDISADFVRLLRERPKYGFGKTLNPCVDCKILLLRQAKKYMQAVGAQALASGAVLGQRPMSQRRDTLNVIQREAGVEELLVRPLSAQLLVPTVAERNGLLQRDKLLKISGRGRNTQFQLAQHFGLTEIPTPGGGCHLTEKENARRYGAILTRWPQADQEDFYLANIGRQFWRSFNGQNYWLTLGRNEVENERLSNFVRAEDALLVLDTVPGPSALARNGVHWPEVLLEEAGNLVASYANKIKSATESSLSVHYAEAQATKQLTVRPERNALWACPGWEEVRSAIVKEA